jgi:hypothetical protein
MKLRIDVETYDRRLSMPLRTARGALTERAGFLLRLSAPDGCEGWGEAAPIYWIDDDPLDVVGGFLLRVVGEVEVDGFESASDVPGLLMALRARAGEPGRLPALRWRPPLSTSSLGATGRGRHASRRVDRYVRGGQRAGLVM